MITFLGKNEITLNNDNTHLLKNVLTGCQLLLHLKDDSMVSKYTNAFDIGMRDWKKSWKRNTDGNPLLNIYLIDMIEGGEFYNSKYEAVVLSPEGDEIIAWSHVIIDSEHRRPDSMDKVINIQAFGFNTLSSELVNSREYNNDFLISTDDFHLMILAKCRFDTLQHLRRMFELCPAAKVYNSFKIDSANLKRLPVVIEKYEEIISNLRELRLQEQATPRKILSGRKKKYTEVTHWQETNLRMKVRELRKEQFKNVRGFLDLEEFWFDRIKPQVISSKIEIDSDIIMRNNKIVDRDSITDGDLFVKIIKNPMTSDRFLLQLVIAKMNRAIPIRDKEYDEVLYSLQVNLNETRFDYMNFMTI